MADRFALARLVGLAFSLVLLVSCGSTLDSLGCRQRGRAPDGGTVDPGLTLRSLLRPESYPNAFRDLLGKSDDEIAAKIADTFDQLFHGDPTTQSIFVPVGTDQAYIRDVLHDQVRTEGMGLGMLIAVMLDKRDEFDRLWRYTKSMQIVDGPARGYFPSFCGGAGSGVSCNDPFGIQQITTALLLARGRWQAAPGAIDYGLEAASLLDLIRNLEAYNCGVVDGTTGLFDAKSKLPYDTPTTAAAGVSRPSIVMPAYYDLWHQATGDPFWSEAAVAARAYWQASAHPTTGLLPDKATFDGKPVPDFENFDSECQRIWLALALDRVWSGTQSWPTDESNRVLQFFYGKGLTTYGRIFSLDGTTIQTPHERSLVAANGMLALVATDDIRRDFVSEVWDLGAPVTGTGRYYPGLMQLLSVVLLGGQMQVY